MPRINRPLDSERGEHLIGDWLAAALEGISGFELLVDPWHSNFRAHPIVRYAPTP